MRYALLVAWREFAENVKTKGFWIGIFIFPVILWVSISAEGWLEKAKPVRNFVLVDQSGELQPAVEVALDRLHQRKVLEAFASYVRKNARAQQERDEIDLETVPAIKPEDIASKWASDNPEAVEEFLKGGGITAALEQVHGILRDDAPPFEEPRRPFRRVDLPGDIRADLDPAERAEQLKPYLRGERSIEVDGEPEELFAAVLIPADIEEKIVRPGGLPVLPGM